MIIVRRPLVFCLALLSWSLAVAVPSVESARARNLDVFEAVRREPMIFFVAKGAPNACGPGCSEWIAADGLIDLEAVKRLLDFVAALPRRDLPIFFHSRGGNTSQAMAIGAILREHRMTAGVGRTLPDGCRNGIDEACRRLMQSKSEHKARLITAGARCFSNCVYALVGASVRQVARDTQLGIHSNRTVRIPGNVQNGPLQTVDDVNRILKLYVIEMGVDPGLIDAAAKISADSMRVLTRDEIARFGIEVGVSYETAWTVFQLENTKKPLVFKSVTQADGPGGREYRTSNTYMWCIGGGRGVGFLYRRETHPKEEALPVIRVAAGESEYILKEARAGSPTAAQTIVNRIVAASADASFRNEQRSTAVSREFLRNAMAAPGIVVTEETTGEGAGSARVIKLSAIGLAKALEPLLQECE